MRHASIRFTAALCAILLTAVATHAQSTQPTSTDFAQTPMRVQTLRGQDSFLYCDADTTIGELGDSVRSLSKQLVAAREAGKAQFAGQMIITMTGTPGDPTSPIKLRVGFPVRAGATAPEGTTLGKLDSQRAATTVFSGNSRSLREAFGQLYTELAAAGLEPTGEMRQLFAYYEGPDSDNNVFILQVLIK